MRKNALICFVVFVLAATFVHAVRATTQTFDRDLQYGMTNDDDVKRLQQFLTDEGYFTGDATGNFFSLTKDAVIAFQQANNISPATGYFGPITRNKVNQKLTASSSFSSSQSSQKMNPSSPSLSIPTPVPYKPSTPTQIIIPSPIGNLSQPIPTHKYFYGKIKFLFPCTCNVPPTLYIEIDGNYGYKKLIAKPGIKRFAIIAPGLKISGESKDETEICAISVFIGCVPTGFSGHIIKSLDEFSGL